MPKYKLEFIGNLSIYDCRAYLSIIEDEHGYIYLYWFFFHTKPVGTNLTLDTFDSVSFFFNVRFCLFFTGWSYTKSSIGDNALRVFPGCYFFACSAGHTRCLGVNETGWLYMTVFANLTLIWCFQKFLCTYCVRVKCS